MLPSLIPQNQRNKKKEERVWSRARADKRKREIRRMLAPIGRILVGNLKANRNAIKGNFWTRGMDVIRDDVKPLITVRGENLVFGTVRIDWIFISIHSIITLIMKKKLWIKMAITFLLYYIQKLIPDRSQSSRFFVLQDGWIVTVTTHQYQR